MLARYTSTYCELLTRGIAIVVDMLNEKYWNDTLSVQEYDSLIRQYKVMHLTLEKYLLKNLIENLIEKSYCNIILRNDDGYPAII